MTDSSPTDIIKTEIMFIQRGHLELEKIEEVLDVQQVSNLLTRPVKPNIS